MLRRGPSNARLFAGVFVFALLLGACTAPQTRKLTQERPADLPARIELASTPFFPQTEYQCGPAALATVLVHSGVSITPEQLTPEVFLPARAGSLQVEMLAAARGRGMLAYRIAPQVQSLLTEIAAGNPVVVLQNLALPWYPQWHYAVAIGYDLGARTIILRSGRTERVEYSLSTFERTWARSQYWGMLALAAGTIPRTAEQTTYLDTVVALEQVKQTRAAQAAYSAAITRWPRSAVAHIGLGNTTYALGDLTGSEQAFAAAAELEPQSVVAWNNLAQVRSDQGKFAPAMEAAERAVALGGPQEATARATLEEIRAKAQRR